METSQLIFISFIIVLCFVFQTNILKTHISESLGSVEETSGIIEERGKMFTNAVQDILHKMPDIIDDAIKDVPSVMSHLKEVHTRQKVHEYRILHAMSQLKKYSGCHDDGTDKPIYITVSFVQILWLIFGILFVALVVCILRLLKKDKDAEELTGFLVLGEGGLAIVLVSLSLWQWFRPGFWLLVCVGACFVLIKLNKCSKQKKQQFRT